MTALVFDLCAGADGWLADADDLDLRAVGFDIDPDACATSRAAGHHRVQDDIARLVPAVAALVYGEPDGIIASPPCQLFSGAGKGTGRQLMEELHRAVTDAAKGATDVTMARHRRELRRLLYAYLRETEGYKRARGSRHRKPGGKAYTAESTPIRPGELRAEADRMARNVSLVWQPARWVAALRPRWVALEQVPAVLPLWEAMARALEVHGYRCWTGVLSAERYGVPQTRKRAILLASLDYQPQPPEATHQAYVPGEPARAGEPDLFGPGLRPWRSMAEALGWGSGRVGFPRRDDTGTSSDGYRDRDWRATDEPAFALTEKARSFVYEPDVDPDDIEVEVQRSEGSGGRRPRKGSEPAPTIRGGAGGGCGPNLDVRLVNGTHAHRAERALDEPAPTLHFGGRLNTVSFVTNSQANATERRADEPAPTIKGGHDTAERQWVVVDTGNTRSGTRPDGRERPASDPAVAITSRADQLERRDAPSADAVVEYRRSGERLTESTPIAAPAPAITSRVDRWQVKEPEATHYDSRQQRDTRTGEPVFARRRAVEEPAPTIAAGSRSDAWVSSRPATTVNGDARISQPGHHDSDVSGSQQANAVRVSVQEAAILQSFPPDWPWVGTQTSQFQQIGNAIPPRLARAILRAVMP